MRLNVVRFYDRSETVNETINFFFSADFDIETWQAPGIGIENTIIIWQLLKSGFQCDDGFFGGFVYLF